MIPGVTASVVSIVGLPLLASWPGGRRFWSRLRPGRGPDPWGDLVRGHGLTAGEAARVRTAVSRGQRLDDGRLRRAAADLAGSALSGLRWRGSGRGRRVLLVLVGLWLLLQVLTALVRGGPGDVPWVTVVVLLGGVVAVVVLRRRLRRALELNGGPPA